MISSVYWEWEFFLLSIRLGIKLALLYEGITIFRMLISHNHWIKNIEDLCYWIYAAALLFKLQYEQSNGVFRGFSVLGVSLGMMIYYNLIGRYIRRLKDKGRRAYGSKKNSNKEKEAK